MVSLVEGDEHDPSGKASVTGVVVERAMHFLKIAVDEEDEALVLGAGKLRLDLSANTVSHDRALARACGVLGVRGHARLRRRAEHRRAPQHLRVRAAAEGGHRHPGRRRRKTVRDARASVAALAAAPPPWAGKDASGAVRARRERDARGGERQRSAPPYAAR